MGAKDVVRKALASVTPGQTLTQLPGPRVLIHDPGSQVNYNGQPRYSPGLFDPHLLEIRLSATVPTVKVARRLSDYNLNEWDCVVTVKRPVTLESTDQPSANYDAQSVAVHSWEQAYPDHLSVVCVVTSGGIELVDAAPASGTDELDLPPTAILRDPDTVGRHIRQVDGLPDYLSAVVRAHLIPIARDRSKHLSFRRWTNSEDPDFIYKDRLHLRPFLLGPDDVILAGSYERNAEASVWLLPDDVPDLFPWVSAALSEWHEMYPSRFPARPDWHGASAWKSHGEVVIEADRAAVFERYRITLDALQGEMDALDEQAEAAATAADRFQRALLTADGALLAEAVGCALATLGFHVVDMDEHWHDGDRREDLRVFRDDDPDWVAIVEVKGAKNGARETEVQNFGRWVERFILDEHRAPSARWFVTNHQRQQDPDSRQEAFANKPAVVETFAKSGGTVIDTRALFDLVRLVEERPSRTEAARTLLRTGVTPLTRVAASALDDPAEQPTEG